VLTAEGIGADFSSKKGKEGRERRGGSSSFALGRRRKVGSNALGWRRTNSLPSSPLLLAVGPLNTARRLGERCKLPSGVHTGVIKVQL